MGVAEQLQETHVVLVQLILELRAQQQYEGATNFSSFEDPLFMISGAETQIRSSSGGIRHHLNSQI
jgi:hypothetical protein